MVLNMTFTKINEKTIQCVIDMNEIGQMGYVLEELYTNREAASNFMRSVMERGVEAGYQLNRHLQEIQVTLFSDQQLVLSFVEVSPDKQVDQIIANVLDTYEGVKAIGKEHLEEIQNMSGEEKLLAFQEVIEKYHNLLDTFKTPVVGEQREEKNIEKEIKKEMDIEDIMVKEKKRYMFRFSNLSNLKQLSKAVTFKVPSHLYRDKQKYYLLVDFSGMEQDRVNSFMVQVLDYEAVVEKNKFVLAHVEEHADNVIEDGAIEVLRKL
jgi:negative regulator of genetic competence, sporulation and motility